MNGTITSPNYPLAYNNSLDCEWYVIGPAGHNLNFTFTDIQLEPSEDCSFGDYVEIRDLNSTGISHLTVVLFSLYFSVFAFDF